MNSTNKQNKISKHHSLLNRDENNHESQYFVKPSYKLSSDSLDDLGV